MTAWLQDGPLPAAIGEERRLWMFAARRHHDMKADQGVVVYERQTGIRQRYGLNRLGQFGEPDLREPSFNVNQYWHGNIVQVMTPTARLWRKH
jgi:hypothetical protein